MPPPLLACFLSAGCSGSLTGRPGASREPSGGARRENRTKYGPCSRTRKIHSNGKRFSALRGPFGSQPIARVLALPFSASQAVHRAPQPACCLVRIWSVCCSRNPFGMRLFKVAAQGQTLNVFAPFWNESRAVTTWSAAVNRMVAGSSPARGAEKSGGCSREVAAPLSFDPFAAGGHSFAGSISVTWSRPSRCSGGRSRCGPNLFVESGFPRTA